MRRLLASAILLSACSVANAWDRREHDFYHVRTNHSNTSMCEPGDTALGGGFKCPFHANPQMSVPFVRSNIQGWKVVCFYPESDPIPLWVDVTCAHETCVPGGDATCQP